METTIEDDPNETVYTSADQPDSTHTTVLQFVALVELYHVVGVTIQMCGHVWVIPKYGTYRSVDAGDSQLLPFP